MWSSRLNGILSTFCTPYVPEQCGVPRLNNHLRSHSIMKKQSHALQRCIGAATKVHGCKEQRAVCNGLKRVWNIRRLHGDPSAAQRRVAIACSPIECTFPRGGSAHRNCPACCCSSAASATPACIGPTRWFLPGTRRGRGKLDCA